MEPLMKTVNGWKPLTVSTKNSILDVWVDTEYNFVAILQINVNT